MTSPKGQSGCLLALLGGEAWRVAPLLGWSVAEDEDFIFSASTLAAACVRVALELGRWPGGHTPTADAERPPC